MALPTETEIMREIGLGNHYTWFNGSGSCRGIRNAVADRLVSVLRERRAAGEDIAAVNPRLIALVRRAAMTDKGDYVLTTTWQVASDVIRAHLEARGARGRYAKATIKHWSPKLVDTDGWRNTIEFFPDDYMHYGKWKG